MQLTFLGATRTVTGSKYLLDDGTHRILVDCGLFQGLKNLRERNWVECPIPPSSIHAVLLTHAHIDHSGYIPRLVAEGFQGKIYCSDATYDLCKILLPDSGRIHEEDAERANKYGYTKHHPALPLYTEAQAKAALEYFQPVSLGIQHEIPDSDFRFSLHRAGHILGATFIRLVNQNTSILFSGDLGRADDPVMPPPAQIQDADYIVVESTYGDRLHDTSDPAELLANTINKTIARNGTVVIPSFAVGRTQSLLYFIHKLKKESRIPSFLPIYLDSPMAIDATELLCKHQSDHKLPRPLCAALHAEVTFVRSREESKALDTQSPLMPSVILSASGMATGGRVLHHLKRFVGDPKNTILLVGFQAEGTRGSALRNGVKEIKIHGAMWPVNAEICTIDSLSAHADYAEILRWLGKANRAPLKTFITHGELAAAACLQEKITADLGWDTYLPDYMETVSV